MGRSGITIPNPIRSMKTVRKRTTSGERRDGAGAGTARGNRKTPRAVKASAPDAAASSAAFGAEPPQTTNDVARLAEQRFAQPRRRRVEIAIAQRAQPARGDGRGRRKRRPDGGPRPPRQRGGRGRRQQPAAAPRISRAAGGAPL